MNAPWWELVIRLGVAGAATTATTLVYLACRRGMVPLALLRYLGAVLGLYSAYRWSLVWLGMQRSLGDWSWLVPYVQPTAAAFQFLIVLAIALIVGFRLRHLP